MLYGENIGYSIVLYNTKYSNIIQKFNCGNDEIDKYLKEKAYYDLDYGRGVTKLFLNDNKDRVIGFYTLRCSSMVVGTINTDIHLYPAVEIKMFAVDKEYQDIFYCEDKNEGVLSDYLLGDIITDINDFTDKYCGANFVIIYSVPKAIKFYRRNRFDSFKEFMKRNNDRYLDGCEPMYLEL